MFLICSLWSGRLDHGTRWRCFPRGERDKVVAEHARQEVHLPRVRERSIPLSQRPSLILHSSAKCSKTRFQISNKMHWILLLNCGPWKFILKFPCPQSGYFDVQSRQLNYYFLSKTWPRKLRNYWVQSLKFSITTRIQNRISKRKSYILLRSRTTVNIWSFLVQGMCGFPIH